MDVPPQEMETNTHYTGNRRLGPALSFTYGISAVALERGVADDKRTILNVVDGTANLRKQRCRGRCPTAGRGA